jgi:hypothetical protein
MLMCVSPIPAIMQDTRIQQRITGNPWSLDAKQHGLLLPLAYGGHGPPGGQIVSASGGFGFDWVAQEVEDRKGNSRVFSPLVGRRGGGQNLERGGWW